MNRRDELLQTLLEELEQGKPLEAIFSELPAGDAELVSLLLLSSSLRSLPDPPLNADTIRAWDRQVRPAIQARANLNGNGTVAAPRPAGNRWRLALPVRRLAGGLAALLAVLLIGLWALSLARIARPDALVNVTTTQGQLFVAGEEDAASWELAPAGMALHAGQHLRTPENSVAVLTFFEGSQLRLEPGTELVLDSLEREGNGALSVSITQVAGKTYHSVVPRSDQKADYVVHTPAGTALVQGTLFGVFVEGTGEALYLVERGQIVVRGAGQEVVLPAGQLTIAIPGQAPAPGASQALWSGETITPASITQSWPTIMQVQTPTVTVTMTSTATITPTATATGTITATATVTASVTPEPTITATATITATIPPTPTATSTPSPTAGPSVTPTPTPVQTAVSDCTGVNPHPTGTALAERYGVPYEEIMQRFCSGYGFGEIDLAYGLSEQTSVAVTEIFAMRESGMGWGQIMQALGVLPGGDDNPPVDPPGGPPDGVPGGPPDNPPGEGPPIDPPGGGPPDNPPGGGPPDGLPGGPPINPPGGGPPGGPPGGGN